MYQILIFGIDCVSVYVCGGREMFLMICRFFWPMVQGFSWTDIYFGHFVQAAPILFRHLEIF